MLRGLKQICKIRIINQQQSVEPAGTNSDIIENSEYNQEIPQSQTADNPVAPRGRAAQPSQDTRKTN